MSNNFKKMASSQIASGSKVGGASSGARKSLGLKLSDIGESSESEYSNRYPSELNPGLIVPRASQQRSLDDVIDTSDIDESISERGVDQALIVRPSIANPGQFEIISGERRWRSAIKNNIKSVPVIVRDCDDYEFELIQWSENNHRKDLSLYDQLMAVKKIYDAAISNGKNEESVRKVLGNGSKSWLSYRLSIINGPSDVLNLAKKESDLRKLYELSNLSKSDPDLVSKLVDEMEKGINISRDDILKIKPKKNTSLRSAGSESKDIHDLKSGSSDQTTVVNDSFDNKDTVNDGSLFTGSVGQSITSTGSNSRNLQSDTNGITNKQITVEVLFDGVAGFVDIQVPDSVLVRMDNGMEATIPVDEIQFIRMVD